MTVTTSRPTAETPSLVPDEVSPASEMRWLAPALILLAVGVTASTLLGPLTDGVIEYHVSPEALNQIVGSDLAALVLVAPVSVFAAILAWRRHPAAPVVALGPAVFAAYTYTQLALGGDVARYPGNSERFFLLHLALVVLGGAIALASWASIDADQLPPLTRRAQRALGGFVLVVAAFLVVGLHLPTLVDAWRDQPVRVEYLADPVVFWLVKFMDLGIIVPTLVAVGIGLFRGAGWAHKGAYAVIGWFALLGASVAAMAIIMQVEDDPSASSANTAAFGLFALVGLAIAVRLFWPLLARPSWPSPQAGEK